MLVAYFINHAFKVFLGDVLPDDVGIRESSTKSELIQLNRIRPCESPYLISLSTCDPLCHGNTVPLIAARPPLPARLSALDRPRANLPTAHRTRACTAPLFPHKSHIGSPPARKFGRLGRGAGMQPIMVGYRRFC